MNLSQAALRTLAGFTKAMVPTFEKMRLLEDLDSSHKKLRDLEPFFNTHGQEFARYIKQDFPALDAAMRRHVGSYRGNVADTIHKAIKLRIAEQEALSEYVDGMYGRVILRDAIDYEKLMMLRYASLISFFVDYARKMMLMISGAMTSDVDIATPIDRKDTEFVRDPNNIDAFARVLNAMSTEVKDIRDAFEDLKKVQFNPDMHDINMRTGGGKMDPMGFGYLPGVGSLVYFLGRQWNDYLSHTQEEAQIEKEKLEVKLTALRHIKDGDLTDSERERNQRQLDYYNNRLNKLDAKLKRLKEGD